MSGVINVAIVDDHPSLYEGAAAILAREADLEVVACAGTLEQGRELLAGSERIDVLVLDVRLQDASGLLLLDEVRALGPGRPSVVVWTGFDIPQYADYSWKAGAAGFVFKTAPLSELVLAIRTAARGGTHFMVDVRSVENALSPRERDVVAGVIAGRSNDEIATSLGVTRRAVELHLTHVYKRYEIRSRIELSAWATREGWLDVPASRAERELA